jgi:hypothetical protein
VKEEIQKRFFPVFEKFLGKFEIEIGNGGVGQNDSYPPEVRELRKYFKEALWEIKKKEIFGRK